QGEHKIARGYEPVITRSAHFIPDPGFRSAIADFLERERSAVDQDAEWLRVSLPYRSSSE
ncbi:MAG TPA: peptidogalycan biosysnthesis protein, partial [Sphingomicrobium sp.]|nr:peptidogalycan biosysnthesis protein [Sphingomicrobium sp.]